MGTKKANSLWQRNARNSWPELDAAQDCAVLVIGAGLAGCATARELERHGVDVLLVDERGPGQGASGRNAGFVLQAHATEYPALRARLGEELARDLLALAQDNRLLITSEFATHCDFEPSGSVVLPMANDAAEIEAVALAGALLAQDGVEVAPFAPPAALRGFGPGITLGQDGQLQPFKLTLALCASLRRTALAGIRELDLEGGRAATDGGHEIRFERLVVTTNALAGALLPDFAPHIVPQRAQALATEPLTRRYLDRPVYAGGGFDYFRQLPTGEVILGGRRQHFLASEATTEEEATTAVQSALDAYLAAHLPFASEAKVAQRWAGIMGFSRDGLPALGPCHDRAWLLAGFTGHGLGLALSAARLLVTSMQDPLACSPRAMRQLACLSPARFAVPGSG